MREGWTYKKLGEVGKKTEQKQPFWRGIFRLKNARNNGFFS